MSRPRRRCSSCGKNIRPRGDATACRTCSLSAPAPVDAQMAELFYEYEAAANITVDSRPDGTRLVSLSDTQAPFQDEALLEAVDQFVKDWQPNDIAYNGDILDMYEISTFDKRPLRQFNIEKEEAWATAWLDKHKALAPRATQFFIEGNHEERLTRFVWRNAGPLASHVKTLPEALGLRERGVQHVTYGKHVDYLGFVITHGNFVSNDSAATARRHMQKYNSSGVNGHCFDEETEILTPDGWRTHHSLKAGDIVLTMDPNSDHGDKTLHWDTVQEVFRYDDFDELVRIRAQGVDVAVTGGHGLMRPTGGKKRGRGWGRVSADEMFGREMVFPLAGLHDDEHADLSDDQIRFIAWVMAEGNFDFSGTNNKSGSLRIAQSDYDGHLEALEPVLDAVTPGYSKRQRYSAGATEHGQHRNYDAYRYTIPVLAWASWLPTYLTRDKTPTRALAGMSSAQIAVFLDTYVLADGSVNKAAKNSRQIATNRRDHADFLQELAVRSGHRSTLIQRGDMFYLTLNSRSSVETNANSWSREAYSGTVWCVSVNNGTLVVRRRGRTAITANTHRLGAYSRTDMHGRTHTWYEQGCLCRIDLEYVRGVADWQQGFLIGTVHGGALHPQLIHIIETGKGRGFYAEGNYYKVHRG